MLKISEDGLFLISMPEHANEYSVINISITSVGGQICSRDALIENMIRCKRNYKSNIENGPQIIFFVNFEGKTFAIDGSEKMTINDFLREMEKYLK